MPGGGEIKKKVAERVSLNYFLGIALGEMGLSPEMFWEMRLKYFFLKLYYYNKHRQNELEARANLMRMQTIALINIQLLPKDRIRDPRKFWLFPWETETEVTEVNDIGNAKKLGGLL